MRRKFVKGGRTPTPTSNWAMPQDQANHCYQSW